MSDAYSRLKALWETDGRTVEPGSREDGAAYALAAALGTLQQQMDEAVAALLPIAPEDYAMWAGLLGLVQSRFTPQALEAEVRERLAHSFGDYTVSALRHAFTLVGSGSFSSSEGSVTFSGVAEEDLGELGRFIAGFLLPWNTIVYNGDGMTFDEWDAMELTFYGYDSLLLPFAVLDCYRRT